MKLLAILAAGLSLSACMTAPPALPSPVEAVVQRQLEAYNAHDLEGFAATYSPDVELFDLPDASKPTLQGMTALRETYGRMFSELPKLRCDVARRIADGAFVVDHEICDLGVPGEAQMRAVAIYQVENGLIRRVWFAPADQPAAQ